MTIPRTTSQHSSSTSFHFLEHHEALLKGHPPSFFRSQASELTDI